MHANIHTYADIYIQTHTHTHTHTHTYIQSRQAENKNSQRNYACILHSKTGQILLEFSL